MTVKRPEGIARLFGFVDCARLKGHGDGVGLVLAGIPKFAVDQDGDGHQRGFAIGRELKHGEGTRSGILLFRRRPLSGRDLGTIFLGRGRSPKRGDAGEQGDEKPCTV